jgi:hypothetical protein
LTPVDLAIDAVDDRAVRDAGIEGLWNARNVKFTIPPGRHEIGISRPVLDEGAAIKLAGFANLCFELIAGHDYRVRPLVGGGGSWTPEVTDATTGAAVVTDCAAGGATPNRAVTGSASAPPASWVETSGAGSPRRPGNGPSLRAAVASGGDTLFATTLGDGLDAGDGTTVAIAWAATPFWNERLGFGGGLELGWKRAQLNASNGSARFIRYPLVLSVHALNRLSRRWFMYASAGVEKHFAAHTETSDVSGTSRLDFGSNLGAMSEFGLKYWVRRHFSIELGMRFSFLSYVFQGASVDGTNVAAGLAVRFDL